MKENDQRQPIAFSSASEKHKRKWEAIISAFMAGDINLLRTIQRIGARGRIFAVLIKRCFETLNIEYLSEPIFSHIPENIWYADFAVRYGLKLRVNDIYNPDFLLSDGSWAEVTLSENTAYKKLFRYAHQAHQLLVIWLDPDVGLHKQLCEGLELPNATVRTVDWYYPYLDGTAHGRDIIMKLETLKSLKRDIL